MQHRYVADDGTIFETEKECLEYEKMLKDDWENLTNIPGLYFTDGNGLVIEDVNEEVMDQEISYMIIPSKAAYFEVVNVLEKFYMETPFGDYLQENEFPRLFYYENGWRDMTHQLAALKYIMELMNK